MVIFIQHQIGPWKWYFLKVQPTQPTYSNPQFNGLGQVRLRFVTGWVELEFFNLNDLRIHPTPPNNFEYKLFVIIFKIHFYVNKLKKKFCLDKYPFSYYNLSQYLMVSIFLKVELKRVHLCAKKIRFWSNSNFNKVGRRILKYKVS